ncbi:unnamed protein product [Albugo candida]|uniref:B30.2/SPRY domain-containing protein n=1 Tax=Albugo candida TaxID=65357 RepID=A0A024FXZ7_9STRA|nr:unnamed protein product [Albugo candida]|eukprot:CCI39444.1 unnamed protein product [Albugo candida]
MQTDRIESAVLHVATPYGCGRLITAEERPDADSDWIDSSMVRVEFPWGYMRIHVKEVNPEPEFTFYALMHSKRHKFRHCFALDCLGVEIIESVRKKLQIPDSVTITLVQTDSVQRIEIKPTLKLVECLINLNHPILVLLCPMLQFHSDQRLHVVKYHDQNTRIIQTGHGCASVFSKFHTERGVNYWEVEVICGAGGDGILIGVASDILTVDSSVYSQPHFWGISCLTGHKVHGIVDAFTAPMNDGDIVGVLMDTNSGHLSFYKNKHYLGIAFRHVRSKKLLPVFSTTAVAQTIRLLQTACPPLG